ncbi:MAG TPA: UDP binding domain-containing protein, partial [Mycobacteriales bacterium]
ELANDINDHMPDYVASRLMRALNRHGIAMSRARVLVLGLAYKRNAGDARESPAVALIHRLVADGAEVAVADPHVVEEMAVDAVTRRVELTRDEVERADAVVLVTDHDAFDYAMVQRHATLILDTRHRLDGPDVEQL